MADVVLAIGGYEYTVVCRDGEEDHLRAMGAMINEKAESARAAVGGLNEVRQLLFASLLMADELADLHKKGALPVSDPALASPNVATSLAQMAERIEAVASALENAAQ